jgi:hypothetical protein
MATPTAAGTAHRQRSRVEPEAKGAAVETEDTLGGDSNRGWELGARG